MDALSNSHERESDTFFSHTIDQLIYKQLEHQNTLLSQQTRRYWYNIVPITFHVYVVYRNKTCIYTILNRPKVICAPGKCTGFCWPVHDVL